MAAESRPCTGNGHSVRAHPTRAMVGRNDPSKRAMSQRDQSALGHQEGPRFDPGWFYLWDPAVADIARSPSGIPVDRDPCHTLQEGGTDPEYILVNVESGTV